MPRFRYSPEMIVFLRDGYKKWRVPELTEAFNTRFGLDKSEKAIKTALIGRKFKSGRKSGFAKGERILLLTPEQIEFVKEKYQSLSVKELLAALNDTHGVCLKLSQLKTFLKNHKILSGRTGCFEKGHIPHNTGTKGVMKPNSGSFQKGHKPKNYKPIGSERVCCKDGYVLVKVAEENPFDSSASGWYRHKHVVLWEEHNGPVPDGYCIRFADGDKTNITIENLILVSRAVNARLTIAGYADMPAEIKPTMVAVAKLEQAVFEQQQK